MGIQPPLAPGKAGIRHSLFIFTLMSMLLPLINCGGSSGDGPVEVYWQPEKVGSNPDATFMPDHFASYFDFFIAEDSSDPIYYKIEGEFPRARYFSMNLYDTRGASLGAISDFEIDPDPGHINPFRPGADREAADRSYTLWVVPQGSRNLVAGQRGQVLEVPPNSGTPKIINRVYLADPGLPGSGGPLPKILAYRASGGPGTSGNNPLAGGLAILRALEDAMDELRRFPATGSISFYNVSDGGGLFPTAHNRYLYSRFDPAAHGEVAVIRFRLPKFPDTRFAGADLTGQEEIRYASFCMQNMDSTGTPSCLADDRMIPDASGMVTLVLADADVRRSRAEQGFQYMDWGSRAPAALIRQMLPREGFSGSYALVPPPSGPTRTSGKQGERFVGDYAPTGSYCSKAAFLASGPACAQ